LAQNPTVTNVNSTAANGSYGLGSVITITVAFSNAVVVTGTPQLALNSGGTASYSSGSGTSTLTFTYSVASGQNSPHLDYTSTTALTLNGGTINDTANNAANLTLPAPGAAGSLGANKSIVVTSTAPPTITKMFGAVTLPPNANTSLSFTITNPNATKALSGIGFTDNLPSGVVVASPNGLSGSCGGGSITAVAGSGSISLTGATLAAGASCSFSLEISALTEGAKNNSTTPVTSNEGGNGNAATATIMVASPPVLTKAFSDSEIEILGSSNSTTLTFTLTNPNSITTLTGLAFTDTLPFGMIVSTPNGLTGSCGGTITSTAGSSSISLSGGTLGAGPSCTFSVNVTGTAIGVQTNITSAVSSNEAAPGAPATASTSVDNLFFLWFFL
jgi:hypothetical protein